MDQINKSATEIEQKLQSGQEPISGKEGKGTAEQPYDQGNAEGTEGASTEGKASSAMQDAKQAVTDTANSMTSNKA